MYTDPQTLTINAIANTLPRTSSGVNNGIFTKDDATVKLSASHQYGKRTRRQARVDFAKIAPNPLISSTNILYTMSSYLVVDLPLTGFTVAEAKLPIDGFLTWLSASSGANLTKLLGGES